MPIFGEIMDKSGRSLGRREIAEEVAEILQARGFVADTQLTDGTFFVVISRRRGGCIGWESTDLNWEATVTDEGGDVISSISTTCKSESQDVHGIAEVITSHSIAAGAELICGWCDDPHNPNSPICGKPAGLMRTYTKQGIESGEPIAMCDEHLASLAADGLGIGNA